MKQHLSEEMEEEEWEEEEEEGCIKDESCSLINRDQC